MVANFGTNSECHSGAGGAYITLNFDQRIGVRDSLPETATFLLDLYNHHRPKYSGKLCDAVDGLSDMGKYSLLLMGEAGKGTCWHRYWTEAKNFAFALSMSCTEPKGKKSGKRGRSSGAGAASVEGLVVALWVFIVIGKEEVVDAWLVRHATSSLDLFMVNL